MADSTSLSKVSKKEVIGWNAEKVHKYVMATGAALKDMLEGKDLENFLAMKATGKIFVRGTNSDYWEQRGISAGTSCELSELSASLADDDEPTTPAPRHHRLPRIPDQTQKLTDSTKHPNTPEQTREPAEPTNQPSSSPNSVSTVEEPEYWDEAREWVARIRKLGKAAKWSVEMFSDPNNHLNLPAFPIPVDVPKDRYLLGEKKEENFHFMGRTDFKQLYGYATSTTECRRLHAVGGLGTSFNLAALAVLLLVEKQRVVFIPDCEFFARADTIPLFRRTLYLAFHNKPDLQKEINGITCGADIRAFFSRNRPRITSKLIFLVDQWQTVEETSDVDHTSEGEADNKRLLSRLLEDISFGYRRIFCSSGNHTTSRASQVRAGPDSTEYVDLWKGFNDTEMKSWWAYQEKHSSVVKALTEDTRKDIERVMGRIPKFMRFARQHLPKYVTGIRHIYNMAIEFSHYINRKYSRTHKEVVHRYYQYLGFCLRGAEVHTVDIRALDHRLFRYDTDLRKILPVAEFVLAAAQRILHQKSITCISVEDYLAMVANFKGNPSVIGFAAEGAVIAAVNDAGFTEVDTAFTKVTGTTFDEDFPEFDLTTLGSRMYIPNKFNDPAIDFLLVHRSNIGTGKDRKKVASLIPVQVTLNYTGHLDAEKTFFLLWKNWVQKFDLENVKITKVIFVWVTPTRDHRETVLKDSLGFTHPEYQRQMVSFKTIRKDLHAVLESNDAYPKPKSSNTPAKDKKKQKDVLAAQTSPGSSSPSQAAGPSKSSVQTTTTAPRSKSTGGQTAPNIGTATSTVPIKRKAGKSSPPATRKKHKRKKGIQSP